MLLDLEPTGDVTKMGFANLHADRCVELQEARHREDRGDPHFDVDNFLDLITASEKMKPLVEELCCRTKIKGMRKKASYYITHHITRNLDRHCERSSTYSASIRPPWYQRWQVDSCYRSRTDLQPQRRRRRCETSSDTKPLEP